MMTRWRTIFGVAILLCLMLPAAKAVLITDKEEYFIGEPVRINTAGAVRIIIDAPEARYRLLDTAGTLEPFIPKNGGAYAVTLLDENGTTIANSSFVVLQGYTNYSIMLDPATPIAMQPTIISITPNPGDIAVTILAPGGHFKYGGPWHDAPFTPNSAGLHEITITKDGAVIVSRQFTVMPQDEAGAALDTNTPASGQADDPAGAAQHPENRKLLRVEGKSVDLELRTSKGSFSSAAELRKGKRDGTYDLELRPDRKFARRLVIEDVRGEHASVGLDEVPREQVRIGKRVLKAYAVDVPFDFATGTLTSVAEGTALYKCQEWNFTTQTCFGTWVHIMNLTPGQEYNLTIYPGDPGYAETGVATVNTRKSVYLPGEIAQIIMVVLDTRGHLVSGADVTLTITAPNGSQVQVENIRQTDNGIYEAEYTVGGEGNYTMFIAATAPNVSSVMESQFAVLSEYPFDIIRDTPATTDPYQGPFDSSIAIVPFVDSHYDFTEVIPASFIVTSAPGAVVASDAASTYLTWQNLSGNQTVNYSAQPPLVTPALFTLGKAFITYTNAGLLTIFEEFRAWFFAIDPEVTRDQGLVVYGDRTPDGQVKFRNWTGTLATEQDSGVNFGNRHAWFRFRCLKARGECLLLTSDSGNDLNFAVFDTNTWAWRNSTQLDADIGHDDQMQFDVECEDTSGDCLIAFEDATANNNQITYYTWNATGLSSSATATVTGGENDNFIWVELYPQRGSDRIGIAVMNDAGGNDAQTPAIYAGIWNGTAFGNWQTLTTNGAAQGNGRTFFKQFDCAWQGDGNFTCFHGENNLNGVDGYRWNGTAWTDLGTIYSATGDEVIEFAACGQEPWSGFTHNDVGLMFCDDAADLDGGMWNGSALSKSATTTTPGVNTNAECGANKAVDEWGRNFECRWERSGTQAVFSWVAVSGQDWITSGTYTRASTTWSMANFTVGSQVSADTAGDIRMIQIVPNQGDDKMFMVYGDSSSDGGCTYWTGSSWDSSTCNGGVAFETGGSRPARQWITFDWFRTSPPQPEITIYTPNGTLHQYNYSGILSPSSTHKAYDGASAELPPTGGNAPATGTEFVSAGYVNVSASDDARHSSVLSGAPTGRRAYQSFNLSVPDSTVSMSSFTITHEGYATETTSLTPDQFYIYIYNYTSDAYVLHKTVFATSVDVISEVTVTSGFNDYIQGRSLLVLIEGDFANGLGANTRADINTDFIGVSVNSIASLRANATINASATDDNGIGLCEWRYYYTNGTVASNLTGMTRQGTTDYYYNITNTSSIADGVYNITVFCNDTLGNRRNATIQARIDNTPPAVSLLQPGNATNFTVSSVVFAWNATDIVGENMECNLTINSTVSASNVLSPHSANTSRNITGIADGTRNWSVRCVDDAGNVNTSASRIFDIDTGGPALTLGTPANNTFTNNATVNFTFTATDAHAILNCSLRLGGVVNTTLAPVTSGQEQNITLSMQEGRYAWNVTCYDSFLFSTVSQTRNLTVDYTKPFVFLNTSNGITFNNTIPQLNYTTYDNIDANITCNITVDDAVVASNVASANNTLISRSIDMPDGVKFWNVTCVDDAGNVNTSITRTFTVIGGPYVVLRSPANGTVDNGTNVNFTYYVEDGDGMRNCSLIINGAQNMSNATPVTNFANNSFLLTNLPQGNHTWTVECYDTQGTSGSATPLRIVSDRSVPVITLNGPTAGQVMTTTPTIFNFTVVDDWSPNATCNLTIDGAVAAANQNFIVMNNTLTARSQTVFNGLHYWNVTCVDLGRNAASSSTRNFTVNVTFPLVVNVTADKELYVQNEIARVNITVRNASGSNASSNLTIDYIFTNTTSTDVPWWNTSWAKRKPIYINESNNTARSRRAIAVNVTGLFGSLSSCNEIRIVSDTTLTEQNLTVIDGDEVSWCYVAFIGSVSAGASNQQDYHVYYNNSGAPAPGYPAILSGFSIFSDDFQDLNTAGWTAGAGWDTATALPMTGNHAHVDGAVTDITIRPSSTFDLSAYENVNLTFSWMIETDWDAGEYIRVDFTNNSEATWTGSAGIESVDGNVNEGAELAESVTLNASHKVTGFNFRFRSTVNDPAEEGGFDNVNMTVWYTIQQNVTARVGTEHAWVARNTSSTNSTGFANDSFNTGGKTSGNYSVVALALPNTSGTAYGYGADWFTISPDVFGPTIGLVSPANSTTLHAGQVIFNYTAYDIPTLVRNCSLYINNILNQSNSTPVNESGTNNFTAAVPEGTYGWKIVCYDLLDNQANSSTYTLTIDDTAPNITAYSPIGLTLSTNNVNFSFNATDNLDTGILCNVSVDNGAYANTTTAANGSNTTVTINGIPDGSHTWNVTCYDNINNSAVSATHNFSIDAVPVVRLHAPPDGFGINATNITLFFNVTEPNLANCSLYLNGALNQTKLPAQLPYTANDGSNNFTFSSIPLGAYDWTVVCYDNSGFSGTDQTRTFQLDDAYPNITLNAPTQNASLYSRTVTFNFTAADAVDPLLSCNITLDGSVNRTGINATAGMATTVNVTSVTVGNHNWSVFCADNTGFVTASETRNFTIIAIVNVVLNSPANNSLDGDGAVNFTYTPQSIGNFLAGYCDLSIDGTAVDTHVGPAENSPNTFTRSGIVQGSHNWYVNCTDSTGKTNVSETRYFIVDSSDPAVTTHTPAGVTLSSSAVFFNWTATDNLDTILTCNVRVNSTLQSPGNIASPNASVTNATYAGFTDGLHYWNVTCTDDAGRNGTSSLKNFTVQEPPTVSLGNPQNNTRTRNTSTMFFYTPRDNSGVLKSCQLILNDAGNQTNTSVLVSGQQANMSVTLPEGAYNWTMNCTDPSNNIGTNSSFRRFTIDLTAPFITLHYPQNGTAVNGNNITFNWTPTDASAPNMTCNMTVTNGTGTLYSANATRTAGSVFNATFNNLADGSHNWTVYCSDDVGNMNTSLTYTFQINQPDLQVNSSGLALSNTNPTIGQNITIYANVSNDGGIPASNVLVQFWDGTPDSGVQIGNMTANVPNNASVRFNTTWIVTQGYHTIWVVVDPLLAIGELNETNNNASMNFSAIFINITSPPNNTITNDTTPEIRFNTTDFTSNNLTYRIYVDGAYNGQSDNVTPGTETPLNLSALGEGVRRIIVEATDSLGRRQNSTALTLRIDRTGPTTAFITQNASSYNTTTVNIRFNITDALSGTLNYTVYLDDEVNGSNTTLNATGANMTFAGLSEGAHSVIIQAIDEVYNAANSSTLVFYVDLTAPQPNITTANLSWFNTSSPTIAFNITDNLDATLNYTLFVDGVANVNGSVQNASAGSATLTGVAQGERVIILQARDDAGNLRNSTPITIGVDLTAPNITLVSPANDSNHTTASVTLNFTANDNMASVLACNLTLDGSVVQQYNLTNATYGTYNAVNLAGGYHYWNVTCVDNATNRNTSATWRFYIRLPDFVVSNITFNNTAPAENDTVVVNATVSNIGERNITTNITVQFWLGNPSLGGTLLSNRTVEGLDINENVTLNITHTAVIGLNQLYVLIDPPLATNGTYPELNESNNILNLDFWVGLYEVFAGGSINELRISDASIVAAFTWNQTNTSGSNVFVADSESTVSFTSLRAIGMNTTNGSSVGGNDFEEIDTRLNTTALNDSVNRTWTSSGTPRGYRNLTAYKRAIIQVPVINSTNTTSFMTGILWDAADGGAYYNGSQDIVFVTAMNQSQAGQYGTYDYEIKVPAKLRDYIAGGGTVTFYTELR